MKKNYLVLCICIVGLLTFTGCASSDSGKSGVIGDSGDSGALSDSGASSSPGASSDSGASSSPGASSDSGVPRETAKASEETTIMIAAAASLETCLTGQIIPEFEAKNPGIKVIGTYDSSGKLKTQIEEGADADLFFSAATKQMDALVEQDLIEEKSIVNLLVNKIVLIVPEGSEKDYQSFEDIKKAENIAIGDPESVPAGQYAKEALTKLSIWDEVLKKSSFGTNVTEVLNWVAEGSADAGIVYATDAAQTDKVSVVAEAPKDSVKNPVYPVGIVKSSAHQDAAKAFIDFLQTEEAVNIFIKNGFAAAD